MGKNKLKKFKEMESIDCVFQYPFSMLQTSGFPMRGRWREEFFHNQGPIVLELGCGKGEYTVGLARRYPDRNFIGIDIKGARMHAGATQARDEGLENVAFLRTSIELLDRFFAPGEVDEIWITFPDPQMKKVRKRLTGTNFLNLYRRVLKPSGRINLKTDSPFLYTYTSLMLRLNSLPLLADTPDLYAPSSSSGGVPESRVPSSAGVAPESGFPSSLGGAPESGVSSSSGGVPESGFPSSSGGVPESGSGAPAEAEERAKICVQFSERKLGGSSPSEAAGQEAGSPAPKVDPALCEIQTYYERQWLGRGLTIKYLAFLLPPEGTLEEPTDEIPYDTYRSFSRGSIEMAEADKNS